MASMPASALQESASLPPRSSSEFTRYAVKLAASIRRGGSKWCASDYDILSSLQKPVETQFYC